MKHTHTHTITLTQTNAYDLVPRMHVLAVADDLSLVRPCSLGYASSLYTAPTTH